MANNDLITIIISYFMEIVKIMIYYYLKFIDDIGI